MKDLPRDFTLDLSVELETVIDKLTDVGAVVIPNVVGAADLNVLVAETTDYPCYSTPLPGSFTVVVDDSRQVDFPDNSNFHQFGDAAKQQIETFFAPYGSLFYPPLNLHRQQLRAYLVGSTGITSHRDPPRFRNLVCIISLSGQATFIIRRTRYGSPLAQFTLDPGHLTIMRAPGFSGEGVRPFHEVTNIVGERLTWQMRQINR